MTIFEFDTVIGKKHKKAILTINDRATDICRLSLFERKETKTSTRAVIEKLKPNEPRENSVFQLLLNIFSLTLQPLQMV